MNISDTSLSLVPLTAYMQSALITQGDTPAIPGILHASALDTGIVELCQASGGPTQLERVRPSPSRHTPVPPQVGLQPAPARLAAGSAFYPSESNPDPTRNGLARRAGHLEPCTTMIS